MQVRRSRAAAWISKTCPKSKIDTWLDGAFGWDANIGEFSDSLLLPLGMQNSSRKPCENPCEKQRAETNTSRRLYGESLDCVLPAPDNHPLP